MSVKIDTYDHELSIRTRVHETETKMVIEKVYDAQPYLEAAAELRARTAGQRWGNEGRHVGFIPMADLGKMMRQDGTLDKASVRRYLQERPALVTFDKYLKK